MPLRQRQEVQELLHPQSPVVPAVRRSTSISVFVVRFHVHQNANDLWECLLNGGLDPSSQGVRIR